MDFSLTDEQERYRQGVREICTKFPDSYWRRIDAEKRYPEEFVQALTTGGWLSVLIPAEYGGAGLGMVEACIVLEEINASAGNGAACHAQMYTMGALLRHGSESQKRRYLPDIAAGRLRLQSMAVTEPEAGSDTSRIATFAQKEADGYVVNGQKVFTSRVQHSDLLLLLARTRRVDDVARKTDGLSLFLVDLRQAGSAIEVRPCPPGAKLPIRHRSPGGRMSPKPNTQFSAIFAVVAMLVLRSWSFVLGSVVSSRGTACP